MSDLIFDIETAAYPEVVLREILAAEHPFDPSGVALGNAKDPERVAAKIEEARATHGNDYVDAAALDARTAMLCAVGLVTEHRLPAYAARLRADDGGDGIPGLGDAPADPAARSEEEPKILGAPGPRAIDVVRGPDGVPALVTWAGEADLLGSFWRVVERAEGRIVGYNSHGFDLPFLLQRSLLLGVRAPFHLRQKRWWSDRCLDLREAWECGAWRREKHLRGGLAGLGLCLGIGGKNGDGAEFARLYWSSDQAEQRQAEAYLRNDVRLTRGVLRRFAAVME